MSERLLRGTPASAGVAIGSAWRSAPSTDGDGPVAPEHRAAHLDRALAALSAAADELTALAAGLEQADAQIVETGALIGQDPALTDAVRGAVEHDGLAAGAAIARAADTYADAIAALDDDTLAARADDVRSLARRAVRLASGRAAEAPPGPDLILVAHDLGPGDVAELAPVLAGIALVAGGPTAHAAIVARSLGIPMVSGLGIAASEIETGVEMVVDGSTGTAVVRPSPVRARAAATDANSRKLAARRAQELRDEPALTTDGSRIAVLANVSSAEELELALRAGAEGIGLLRTELAFLDAASWPTEPEHARALGAVLNGLGDRPAIVRVLDFGADKSPPFLSETSRRGLELLLAHREQLAAQLRAILHAAERHDVRILLPMVETAAQVEEIRALVDELGVERPPAIGSMIETRSAVEHAAAIAARSDFLSIGTNDLTAATVGIDRFDVNGASAEDPRVLRSIARAVKAAHDAGILIEVCGESASEPTMLPLLVGLGVDELSVGAARVGPVRSWIRRLSSSESAGLARSAMTMDSAEQVRWATRALAAELQSDGGSQPRKLSTV